MIEWLQQRPALLKRAQAIKTHGIESLENIAVFSVLWGAAISIDKTLNLLKARDDTFLTGRATAFLLRLSKIVEFRAQFIKVEITHSGPHP